jgi:uncharacterized protein
MSGLQALGSKKSGRLPLAPSRRNPTAVNIAVIADTHDRLPPDLPRQLAAADEIWHLGDVCRPATLEPIAQLGPPLVVVRGNNDATFEWPLFQQLTRGGVVFHLVHIPPRRPPVGATVILHGHTHVPCDEWRLGARWLNPGCITRPNRGAGPSWAWLRFNGTGSFAWEMVPLPQKSR